MTLSNIYFSQFWNLWSPRSRHQQIQCVVRSHFLDGSLVTITSRGSRNVRALRHFWGLHSCDLITPKGSTSKYHHIRISTCEFWRDTNTQTIAVTLYYSLFMKFPEQANLSRYKVVSDCQGFGEKSLIVNMYRTSSRGEKNVLKFNSSKMATHFSILAWNIPWTEEPGGL